MCKNNAAAFFAIAEAGKQLMALHTGYETAPEYPLIEVIMPGATPAQRYRVEKMRLSADKTALVVNSHLTLTGIPPDAFDYKLGSRSALEWVIDQYRVKESSDPNRVEDPEYIVRLVKRIVYVGVETQRIIATMPPLHFSATETETEVVHA